MLRELYEELKAVFEAEQANNAVPEYGFVPVFNKSTRKVLFVNRENAPDDLCWYLLDDAGQPLAVNSNALRGKLVTFDIKEGSYKNSPTYKSRFGVQAGDTGYIIQSGLNTAFTNGVAKALMTYQLSTGINILDATFTFVVVPGDDEKLVFGNVQDVNGKPIMPDRTISDEAAIAFMKENLPEGYKAKEDFSDLPPAKSAPRAVKPAAPVAEEVNYNDIPF
jgi:hypothetical protein